MVCRTTSTETASHGVRGRGQRPAAAFSLVEMLIAMGIGGIVLTAVAQLMFFSGRSIAGMFNYVDLEYRSDKALKILSRDIRQANAAIDATATSLTLQDADTNTTIFYNWSSNLHTLSRTRGAITTNLLTECDFLQFSIYQRNTTNSTYDQYPVATPGTTKLVQVSWVCSRKILGAKVNTESVQSAKFVIRKQ